MLVRLNRTLLKKASLSNKVIMSTTEYTDHWDINKARDYEPYGSTQLSRDLKKRIAKEHLKDITYQAMEKHQHLVEAYCKERKIYVVEVYNLFNGIIDSTATLSLFFKREMAINSIINCVLMADAEDWSEEYDKDHIFYWFKCNSEGDFYDMRIVLTEAYIR